VLIHVATPPHDRRTFEQVSDVLGWHRGDRRVAFILTSADATPPLRVRVEVSSQLRVRPSEKLVAEIERICGPGTVILR
jgi:hypothetical protein